MGRRKNHDANAKLSTRKNLHSESMVADTMHSARESTSEKGKYRDEPRKLAPKSAPECMLSNLALILA